MKHPAARITTFAALVAATLTLTACGGGGEESPDPVDLLLDDRVMRLQRVVERSDSLLVPGLHVGYSVSIGGGEQNETEPFFQGASCSGAARCETEASDDADGTMVTLRDLIDFSTFDLGETQVVLDTRGGFDTVDISSGIDISRSILDDVVNVTPPNARSFGFWGIHGFAGVLIADGPVSGEARQEALGVQASIPFEGELSFAMAFAMGDVTGTDPTGVGSVTWEGIAEVASTRTFERRPGTVEVIIADLARPRASVNVEVDGFRIGPAEWSNVEIADGRFAHGAVADEDYLEGNFHGPAHEEAYGVFDTGSYTGAFGAKRAN